MGKSGIEKLPKGVGARRERTKEEIEREWEEIRRACKGCIYQAKGKYCDYLETAGHRRPCPPGKDCTVKKTGDRRRTVDYSRVRDLYREGKTDEEIAILAGCGMSSVAKWRYMHNYKPNQKADGRQKRRGRLRKKGVGA